MSEAKSWYSNLKKPKYSPPSWIFGPVWTILYLLIALTFTAVFYQTWLGVISWVVALPFALNLLFNFSFSYFQFKRQNNFLASIDILLILTTLIWALLAIWVTALKLNISGGDFSLIWIAILNLPYLLWVSFATVLQLRITYLNK